MQARTRTNGSLPQRKSTLIALGALHPNPDQPRKRFGENALDELASSIAQVGILQPLIVRPRERSTYTIVAGERRWRAAQRINLERVPCVVLRDLDDEQAFILSVTENVARADMDVIEEARAYEHIAALGRSIDEVAVLFGKTADYIRLRLDLLDLRDDAQHLVAHGQMGTGPGWYISRLSLAGQAEVLSKFNAGEFPTDDHACRYAQAVRMREESPELFAAASSQLSAFDAERRRIRRGKMDRAWAKIDALSSGFGPFLECTPDELAMILGRDATRYQQQLDLLVKTVRRVLAMMRQAAALYVVAQQPKKAKRS